MVFDPGETCLPERLASLLMLVRLIHGQLHDRELISWPMHPVGLEISSCPVMPGFDRLLELICRKQLDTAARAPDSRVPPSPVMRPEGDELILSSDSFPLISDPSCVMTSISSLSCVMMILISSGSFYVMMIGPFPEISYLEDGSISPWAWLPSWILAIPLDCLRSLP